MKKNIKIGDAAQTIISTDLWNNKISVPSNEKWTYLSFHRFAACPFCSLRTNELIKHYELFEKHNIEVISIWPSERDILLRYVGNKKSPFPMLSDRGKRIYKTYGITKSSASGAIRLLLHPQLIIKALRNMYKNMEVDADPKLMPASFLIDTDGIIQMAYYGKHFGDHPNIELIFQIKNKTS